jgi:4-hydroxybenzoate polyprenyltransferase
VLGIAFTAVLLAYAVLTIAYSLQLKHLVIVDVLAVATGFALRALAGAVAIDVPVSPWLYAVTTLGALLLASVKRRQEVQLATADGGHGRRVLHEYTPRFLDQMVGVALSATVVAYALYVTSAENLPADHSMLATLPFVLYGLFRFLYVAEQSPAHNVDELIARDRPLLASMVLFALSALIVLAAHR